MLNPNARVPDRRIARAAEEVSSLDLSPIRTKLLDSDHGPGWSAEEVEEGERLYRYFLALQIAYPESEPPVVPTVSADEFWHHHILDTRKYEADCQRLFGRFLHHFPYFGMRGPEDAKALADASEFTLSLMKQHFGVDLPLARTCSGKCSSCRN